MRAARIDRRQHCQRIVEGTELGGTIGVAGGELVEIDGTRVGDLLDIAAAFRRRLRPSRIDENAPHDARRDRKEVAAVLPFQIADLVEGL